MICTCIGVWQVILTMCFGLEILIIELIWGEVQLISTYNNGSIINKMAGWSVHYFIHHSVTIYLSIASTIE